MKWRASDKHPAQRRVARRVVVFLFDTSDPSQFWLTRDQTL
jgi:hypothetical protein